MSDISMTKNTVLTSIIRYFSLDYYLFVTMHKKSFLPWPRRDTTLNKQICYKHYFVHQLSFKFCAKHHFKLKILHFTRNEHALSLKMCSMSLLRL